jgi:hypothetical protein
MPLEYEATFNCPVTGKPVRTGHKLDGPNFGPDENPHGVANCQHCGQPHFWTREQCTAVLSAS